METGIIKDFAFAENYEFKSPSAAAACLLAGESNGLILWVNDEGKKLKELM